MGAAEAEVYLQNQTLEGLLYLIRRMREMEKAYRAKRRTKKKRA